MTTQEKTEQPQLPSETLAPEPETVPVTGGEEDVRFAGKYHSVEALEQGYKELSRLVREKTPEVPEAYEIDFSETPDLAHVSLGEDPLWRHMTPVMQKAELTQPQAEALAKAFVGFQAHHAKEEQEAFEGLGQEGRAMAQQVERFMNKNFSGSEADIAQGLSASVDGMKFLHKMANLTGEQSVPAESLGQPETATALKEKALGMLADPDLAYNREKQEAYNRLWKDISGS